MKNNKSKQNIVKDVCNLIGCSGINKDCDKGNPQCDIIKKIIKNLILTK